MWSVRHCVKKPLFNLSLQFKRVATTCRPKANGFTLVELLVVLSIIVILSLVALPAIQSLQKAGGFTQAVYDISDSFNLSRSYAIAENTYVYVGLVELDRTKDLSVNPQVPGLGRVAMASVATKDGTNGFSGGAWGGTSANLALIRQPQVFDFLHLADDIPATAVGNMARPATPANSLNYAASIASFATTPFSIPLGAAAGGKYNFTSSIGYNSQGSLFLINNGVATSPPQWIEIDLQPVSGNVAPQPPADANVGNQAALLIDGVTGAATVYRP